MGRRFHAVFVPWMMFAFVARTGGQGATWAAAAALVAASLVVAAERRDGRASGFAWSSAALAAALLALGLMTQGDQFDVWGRCLAAIGLTAIAAASPRGTTFLDPYLRDLVAPAMVRTPRFRATARAMAQTWTVALGAVACSFAVAAGLQEPVTSTIGNWLVPTLIVLWASDRAARRWDLDLGEEPGGLYGLFEA